MSTILCTEYEDIITTDASLFGTQGPECLDSIGVLPYLREDAPGFLLKCARTYKSPLIPMMVGPLRVWLTRHPDAVDHVCRLNAANFVKTRFAEKLKPLLGNGVATSNGRMWENSRRAIHPMLKPAEISRMIGQIDEVVTASVSAWAESDAVLDLSALSCALTLKVISRTMFGEGNLENVDSIVKAIDKVQAGLKDYIWSADPDDGPDPAVTHPDFAEALHQVKAAVMDIIQKRRISPVDGDMLAALMQARDPDNGQLYSDQQVLDEVMTIYMAGHETTGNTLAWLWETLAYNPELQEQARQELLAKIPINQPPSYDNLKELPITTAILNETMRLKPSAFWFARTALNDDVIMGTPVKAGDSFFVSQYVVQRLEEYWPNPDQFDHTRWLNGQKPLHKFAFMPFGAGVRTCPGGHFAMAEMCIAMARVLARFELSPATSSAGAREYEALVTLRPLDGMPIVVKPLRRTIYLEGHIAGEHQLLDRAFQLRSKVFVERLNWPLHVDDKLREIDQFDTRMTGYFLVLRNGDVAATARVLPAEQPSLLYNVFPHLIADRSAKNPAAGVWEGARLAINPEYSAYERNSLCARLLADAIGRARLHGVSHIYTVSDPVMEKVLFRSGAHPERLGPVIVDQYGIPALALKIACTQENEESCRAVERLMLERSGQKPLSRPEFNAA